MEKTLKFNFSRSDVKLSTKLIVSVVTLFAAVALPQLFHTLGGAAAGKAFLPMHLPVLFAGLFIGTGFGFTLGLLSPLISYLFTTAFLGTSMPALATLPFMMLELAVYGLICGFFSQLSYKKWWISYIGLFSALILGRVVKWLVSYLVQQQSFQQALTSLSNGYVGIILQLLLLPLILLGCNALVKRERGK